MPQTETEFVLHTREKCGIELVGGKGANISRLVRAGFTTPGGFCITTTAYDYFCDFNNISTKDGDISAKIRAGTMPPPLAENISAAHERYLEGKPCAVRSSSPQEDLAQASFAGQYTSLLNVVGEEALLDAVKECWTSLWNPAVVSYREKMGIDSQNARMAVLVQEMCPAQVAGVLFTEEQMMVEAVWGLGDILVGGETIPDHFVVGRDTFDVVERRVADKAVMSCGDVCGGVIVAQVSEHLRTVPALDDDQIRRLCILGAKVEKLFGCPQDIEWALCDDEFVLLQARPITVLQKPSVWTRANLAEMFPGYMTHLSRVPENRPDFFKQAIQPFLDCFGIKDIPEDVTLIDYIYGHVYMNLDNIDQALGRIPGFSMDAFDAGVGYESEESSQESPKSKMSFGEILKLIPGVIRLSRFLLSLPKLTTQIIPYSAELVEDVRSRDLQELELEELDELVWEMYDRTARVMQVHSCTGILVVIPLLDVVQKTVGKLEGENGTANLLYSGLDGMSSAQLGVETWRLAQSASRSRQVSELILSRRENVLQELGQIPQGQEFLRDWDDFMQRCGDRCSQELELSTLRWEESPQFVLSTVANYLDSNVDPVQMMEEQKRKRIETSKRVLKKLSRNPLKRLAFEMLLKKLQSSFVDRENLKSAWARGVSAMRRLYLAMASKLVQAGVLDSRDDIFYLKMTEVADIVTGKLRKGEFEERIEVRRKEKEQYEHLDVPLTIVGEPLSIEEIEYTLEAKSELEGTGCNPGVVTGRARVVHDPSECLEFGAGEILVAPITNPGWTPLFVTAGGLVMELGSTMSHGVVIAREFGIPAVVGVKNATRIIQTGQLLMVDGGKGSVYIKEV